MAALAGLLVDHTGEDVAIARDAYAIADAMLAARGGKEG